MWVSEIKGTEIKMKTQAKAADQREERWGHKKKKLRKEGLHKERRGVVCCLPSYPLVCGVLQVAVLTMAALQTLMEMGFSENAV